jgi:hypothetical protein
VKSVHIPTVCGYAPCGLKNVVSIDNGYCLEKASPFLISLEKERLKKEEATKLYASKQKK